MIYLASKSPRRKQLLSMITTNFNLLNVDVEEAPQQTETPEDYVRRVARDKANAAKVVVKENDVVISADTEVVLNGKILGKPVDVDDAMTILHKLSGKTHEVISVVVIYGNEVFDAINKSLVSFREISEQERRWYCETFSPMDKAGAYGIQDAAAAFINKFKGSYSGVMGLPILETRQLLQKSGLTLK